MKLSHWLVALSFLLRWRASIRAPALYRGARRRQPLQGRRRQHDELVGLPRLLAAERGVHEAAYLSQINVGLEIPQLRNPVEVKII